MTGSYERMWLGLCLLCNFTVLYCYTRHTHGSMGPWVHTPVVLYVKKLVIWKYTLGPGSNFACIFKFVTFFRFCTKKQFLTRISKIEDIYRSYIGSMHEMFLYRNKLPVLQMSNCFSFFAHIHWFNLTSSRCDAKTWRRSVKMWNSEILQTPELQTSRWTNLDACAEKVWNVSRRYLPADRQFDSVVVSDGMD
jgi:hypothetical protein